MREACDLILEDLDGLMQAVRRRAEEHRRTPDDRADARRACRADDVRAEAGALVRRAGARRRADPAGARGDCRRPAVRRGRHVRAPAAVDRGGRLPDARPRAGARLVAGHSARPPRRAAVGARHHRLVAREVRAGNPRAAEDRDRRGRRAVCEGAEGLLGDAAQAEPDRLRADRRAGAAAARQRRRGIREQRALARARHLALVGRARDPARQLHRPRSHAAALHAHRGGHGGLSGSDARAISSCRAAWCFPARCCSSWRGAASRASRPTSGCSATRCARSTSSATFKALLLADADVTRRCRRRRSSARSTSTSSCGTSITSSTGCLPGRRLHA